MTRVEENKMVVYEIYKTAKSNPSGTYEELVSFHLGTIASMLTDMSKTLQSLLIRQKGAIRNESN